MMAKRNIIDSVAMMAKKNREPLFVPPFLLAVPSPFANYTPSFLLAVLPPQLGNLNNQLSIAS